MKNKIFYLIVVLALPMLSCTSDFLDESPTGTLTGQSALTSPEAAMAFANSAYDNTTVFNKSAFSWGGNTVLLLEYMTGKATSENSQSNFKEFEDLTLSERSPFIEEWWQDSYAGIAKCNLALLKLPEFMESVDEKIISRYQGEVRFMRALYYFHLVRIFGDVPKIMEPQTQIKELQLQPSPIKEIYDEIIIPDLLLAEKSELPLKDEIGRVSMGAVKALLADVYLTYAGYPVQGGAQYYAESAKRSQDVIDSGMFSLFPEYADMRKPINNNKREFIFQVQFSVNKRSNGMVPGVLPSRSGMSAFDLEFGSLIPTSEFVESYVAGDKRVNEKEFFFSTYKGHPSKFSSDAPELDLMDFNAPYIYKFFDENAIDVVGQSGLNWTIYRYADVLLMYAEAKAMADGVPNTLAINSLNAIRNRADLPDFTDTDLESFKKEVWNQRYFELCYENKMWFDITRTRLIRDDATGHYVNIVGYSNNWGKTYGEDHLLFPFPLSEVQANPNLNK